MEIKAVILDFDGVVNDSFAEGMRRIKILAAVHDIHFGRAERMKLTDLWGLPGIDLLEKGLDISRGLAEAFYPEWERMDLELPNGLVPGAKDVLLWLRRNELVSGLLTTRNKQNIDDIFERIDLKREFSVISTRQDTEYRKPDPRAFRFVLEQLAEKHGVTKEQCVFVGDTREDIRAGENAGIETLVVLTGPYSLKHIHDCPIKLTNVLKSIDDLPFWIEENHSGELKHSYL